jgi:hypothetical protein
MGRCSEASGKSDRLRLARGNQRAGGGRGNRWRRVSPTQTRRGPLRIGSDPLLEQIKGAIEAARVQALPSSALAKGCNYTLTLWSRLTRFLDYPQLELSNNLDENAIRPVALGRKNWIHIGSKQAGPRVAAIVSIVETCRRLNIPIRDYLASVLPGLADHPISQTGELTPGAWANRNASAAVYLVRRLPKTIPICRFSAGRWL